MAVLIALVLCYLSSGGQFFLLVTCPAQAHLRKRDEVLSDTVSTRRGRTCAGPPAAVPDHPGRGVPGGGGGLGGGRRAVRRTRGPGRHVSAVRSGDKQTEIRQFSGPWITGAFGLVALAGLLVVAADRRPPPADRRAGAVGPWPIPPSQLPLDVTANGRTTDPQRSRPDSPAIPVGSTPRHSFGKALDCTAGGQPCAEHTCGLGQWRGERRPKRGNAVAAQWRPQCGRRPGGTRTVVHLLRHGKVENPRGVLYGRLPGYHLSAVGRAMADGIAAHLAGADITYLACSPLERARETAAPLAAVLGWR